MNIQDKNGWMVPSHNGYLEFPAQDDTPIAVTVWNHITFDSRRCVSDRTG